MRGLIRILAVASICMLWLSAHALDLCDPATFAPASHRFLEDCSALGRLPSESPERQGIQTLRYFPLGDNPDRFVTLGGEFRVRWERLDPQRFGIAGGQAFSATAERLDGHADVHVNRFRLFVQLNTSAESGWPVARPADHSAADLAQGFMQWNLGGVDAKDASFLRVGRQEIALAPNRLIGVNEATNLRRAFDGAMIQLAVAGTTTTAFVTRPVVNKAGAFDDRADDAERLDGVNWHAPVEASFEALAWSLQSVDAFAFRRHRDRAVFQNASGSEVRDTYGMRLAGDVAKVSYLIQLDWQRGTVGAEAISARAATLDLEWRPQRMPWGAVLSMSLGWAGGDRHPGDGKIGTFDTLYPNLSYGTDAGYFFPGNSWDASVAISVQPIARSTVQAGVFGYWRVSSSDAIYQPPGLVLVRGDGTGSNRVAVLPFLKVAYRIDRYSEVSASAVRLLAGPVLINAGGRSANYSLLQWQFRF